MSYPRTLILGIMILCMSNVFLPKAVCAQEMSEEELVRYANEPSEKTIRALGIFTNLIENRPDLWAEKEARGQLALRVQAYVSSMLRTYRSSNQTQSTQNAESDVRSVANNVLLKNIRIPYTKWEKCKDGQYRVYVCAEIDKDDVINAIQSDSRFVDLDTESIFIE